MQATKVIDITRTYVPVDPNFFPNTLHATEGEDKPEAPPPVTAYEGYNFLPTSYGYKSYFGTNAKFDIPALPLDVKVDRIFIFEAADYKNYFIALTNQGIYVNAGSTAATWDHIVTLTTTPVDTRKDWSWCVLQNALYAYRQGEASYYKIPADFTVAAVEETPTFLNMAGQMGIFKAGSRLGFWDSMGAIAWSSIDDTTDFTPSLTTLAGSAIFNEVKGKITTVKSCGDGFIIYSTNSIVHVARDLGSTFQWNPNVLLSGLGVAYPEQVTESSPDTEQFAYTANGLHRLTQEKAEQIIPEVTDLLKESTCPVSLRMLENRYLALQLIESKFVDGLVQYSSKTYDTPAMVWPVNLSLSDNLSSLSPEQISGMYSLGYFTDQQTLADLAIANAGLSPRQFNAPATPRWKVTFKCRQDVIFGTDLFVEEIPYYDFENGSWGINWNSLPEYALNINEYGQTPTTAKAWHTPVITLPIDYITGVTAVNDFMIQQKMLWDNHVINLRAELTRRGNLKKDQDAVRVAAIKTALLNVNAGNPALPTGSSLNSVADQEIIEIWPEIIVGDHTSVVMEFGPCMAKATESIAKGMVLVTTHTSEAAPMPGQWALDNYETNTAYIRKIASTRILEFDFLDTLSPIVIEGSCVIDSWEYLAEDGQVRTVLADACMAGTSLPYTEALNVALPAIIPADPYPWIADPIDLPDVTITLQDGSQGPVYPTYAGMLVYDRELKKWGKAKCQYTQLLDLSPVNTNQGSIVTTRRFGINAAALCPDNFIYRFDSKPADSYIKYGKIGYFRQGYTSQEEVRVGFRVPCTGCLEIETSLDGRHPEVGMTMSQSYIDATHVEQYGSYSGRWHNITLRGNYDIMHMEYRGNKASRR